MTETGDALGPDQGALTATDVPTAAAAVAGPAVPSADEVAAWAVIDGDVVRQRDQERFKGREIGRIETSREAALVAFGRRFVTLENRVRRLGTELENGRRPGATLARVQAMREQLATAEALGDFDALLLTLDVLERTAADRLEQNRAAKAALCERATELCGGADWNATADALRQLQLEWKSIGSAGREHDTELWARFRASQDAFFSRRAEHIAARTEARTHAEALKTELVARAEEVADSSEWKKVTAVMAELMEAWKAAGSAGRDVDQQLWGRFGAARARFFERRGTHHRDVRQTQERSRQLKENLCREAEALVGAADLAAACQQTKELQAGWKTTGQAPREAHEALWIRFRAACNAVFERAHEERAARESAWRETLAATRTRKREQLDALAASIERDQANLERWENSLASLRDGGRADEIRASLESKIADVTTRLQGKRARHAELEEAVAGLDAKLG